MKLTFTYLLFLSFLSRSLLAQELTNYTANVGNSSEQGVYNVFVGEQAGKNTIRSLSNVMVGYRAGFTNRYGYDNVYIGSAAGYQNESWGNVFVGSGAGYSTSSGYANVFMGGASGYLNTEGSSNIFTGFQTGYNNSTGFGNVFANYRAGYFNTTGSYNIFTGYQTGYSNTTGSYNLSEGYSAGGSNQIGDKNIYLGFFAGSSMQAGNNNIVIGTSAANALISGNDNVLIGNHSKAASSELINAVAIGANSRVALDNAIVLGDPTNTSIAVGIGTDSPQFPLDVRGIINIRNNGTLKFSHLSNPLYQGATDQFLTVNEQGETVLARYQLRINNPSEWSDKVFSPAYTLQPLNSVESFILQNGHLPDIPSAEELATHGVDLVKMNATLLQKIEELTLYSIQQNKRIEILEKKLSRGARKHK